MMDGATKSLALLGTVGGTLGGLTASLQAAHPSIETIGTGALGGGAISLVAWGVMQGTVAAHTKEIDSLKASKVDEKVMSAHLGPMRESLERLHEAVADVQRLLTDSHRTKGPGR